MLFTYFVFFTQCPFEGGDAVYEARSILRKALQDVTFDDALTCGIASTRESKEDAGIVSATLYPNPTAEFTTLNYYGTGATQYILYDMLGKQISTSKLSLDNQSEKIYTINLNAGVYQIALLQENRIIQHLTLSVVK